HRELATPLQHDQAPRLNRIQATSTRGVRVRIRRVAGCATQTGSAGHAGETANLKLTFHLDHSAGADHFRWIIQLPRSLPQPADISFLGPFRRKAKLGTIPCSPRRHRPVGGISLKAHKKKRLRARGEGAPEPPVMRKHGRYSLRQRYAEGVYSSGTQISGACYSGMTPSGRLWMRGRSLFLCFAADPAGGRR